MKKIYKFLGGILFLSISSFLFYDEWNEFYQDKKQQQSLLLEKQEEIKAFSFDSIESLDISHIEFTPNLPLLDTIVTIINQAHTRIYLNTYIFTEKRIREAIVKAQKRGVDVKVILEKNVYKAPNLNADSFQVLQSFGIPVSWANSKNFSLNHAKYMIVDNQVILSTGNYSYSTFKNNKDIFVFLSDTVILNSLLKIFSSDFQGEKKFVYTDTLILSSFDAREKLDILFDQTHKNLDIYLPYIQDDQVMQNMLDMSERGVKIRIITSQDNRDDENIKILIRTGIGVSFSKNNIHAKAMLFDNDILYIGSMNFSSPSIDENREVGLLISNPEVIEQFKKYFSDGFIN